MSEYELPLVFFTVLCQWAVGTIVAITVLVYLQPAWLTDERRFACLRKLAVGVFIVNAIGSLLSLLHLGTPTGAYRAILGIEHSWLSREVVAFFLLNAVAFFWTVAFVFLGRRQALLKGLSLLTSFVGIAAVLVSAQVYYQMSSHPMWHSVMTHLSFIATAMLLGFVTLSLVISVRNAVSSEESGALPGLLPCGILLGAAALLVVILWYGQGLVRQDQLMQSAIVIFSSGLFGWLIFGGVLTGSALAFYLLRKPTLSTATGGILMLVVLSAAVCGRMLFYYGVMSQSPGFSVF